MISRIKPRHRLMQDPRGISLMELLVVMALIGMMAMVGLPTMQQWLDSYRVRSAATEIASAIQLQRMRAVSQNRDFSIAFDANAGTYTLYDGAPTSGTKLEATARSLPGNVVFSGGGNDPVQVTGDKIVFHPDGTLNDRAAQTDGVYVSNTRGQVFQVAINRATGRVDVQHQSYGY